MTQVKAPPAIDIDMLTMALQAGDLNTGWWLDTRTGEVIPAPHDDGDKHDQTTLKSRQDHPERYLDIDPLPETIMVELMESFIATLDHDPGFCESLREALARQQSIWHFKSTLANEPGHEDAWYAFKDQFYALQARQWARDKGLDYEVRHSEQGEASSKGTSKAEPADYLLQLTIEHLDSPRCYEITRQEALSYRLTAYQGRDSSGELLAATNLLASQLEGINPILERLPRKLVTEAGVVAETEGTHTLLVLHQGEAQLAYSAPLAPGQPADQLLTLFNVLLGIQ